MSDSRIISNHYPLDHSERFFLSLGMKGAGATPGPLADATNPDTLVPLDILTMDTWTDPQGNAHMGGLYPFGQNTPPSGHAKQISSANKNIFPRTPEGLRNDVTGKIGFAVIGASNPMHTANYMIDAYLIDAHHNPKVSMVNCAQEGMSIEKMFTSAYWSNCLASVSAAGLTPAQIQCVWFKTDTLENDIDTLSFNDYVDTHMEVFCDAFQRIHTDYPNCKIIYLTGRHTTRWALEGYEKHFEPRAYYCNWITKFLIEEQINGNPNYKCKGAGAVMPTLAWARPFFTNGTEPNSFDYQVTIDNFIPAGDGAINNGVHLSEMGLDVCSDYLLDFFFTDPYTKKWFKV